MASQPSSPLGECRLAAGYTQESFAEKLGVDRSTIGRWERGTQFPQPWQRPDLATALDITLEELDDLLRRTKRQRHPGPVAGTTNAGFGPFARSSADNGSRHDHNLTKRADSDQADHLVQAGIPRLRRALDCIDMPEDGPTPSLGDLRLEVAKLIEYRTEARYVELIWRLPEVIAQVARANHLSPSAQRDAAALLALTLRAADGVAFKFGYLDLSARIIDLMRAAALTAGDPVLVAAVAYVRTETFFATGDLTSAARLLARTADDLLADRNGSTTATATYGSLHMRAAVVAARTGQADTAWDHIDEARRIAVHVPDAVYLGTAFGPASVRIHELAAAVELGDSDAAVKRTAWWHPPTHLPAERRSHFYIELAAAQLDVGRHEDTYRCLATARHIAPEHTREHPQVRRALTTLLGTYRSPSSDLLDLARWARLT